MDFFSCKKVFFYAIFNGKKVGRAKKFFYFLINKDISYIIDLVDNLDKY